MLRKILSSFTVAQRCFAVASNEIRPSMKIVTGKDEGDDTVFHGINKHLEDSRNYQTLMDTETSDYENGVKYLAHMMGKDAESFSQQDISDAVSYLFPSALYSRTARPVLLPPSEIIPKKKNLQCSMDGRPFEAFYYTRFPFYYNLMHEAAELLYKLNRIQDENIRKGQLKPTENEAWKNAKDSTFWVNSGFLKSRTLEPISEHQFRHFLVLMERILAHPYAHLAEDFLMKFRRGRPDEIKPSDLPDLLQDEATGAPYAESYGQRKTSFAEVKVFKNGTGEISVNGGRFLEAFPNIGDREQIITPLIFSGFLGSVDVELQVTGGGPSGQSGAARLAIARAVTCFMDKDGIQRMRFAGLLTMDMRFREKKKSGMPKARATYIWKRR